ncbi:Dabb family protein [Sphaerisporangium aureirubrum]|uniref:Dabb family protein n=1 Tax=Sphaerisporangium aureirubrum TaxID=1544736 RepID=A0ABW1NTN7_9ACTN
MFRHVVMFTWIAGTTEQQRSDVMAELAKLPGVIPEIRRYDMGPDAGVNPGNHEFVVVADFGTLEDYLVYRDHPVHRDVIQNVIRPIMASRAAVQYELPALGER